MTGNSIGNLWQRINVHITGKAFFTYKQPNIKIGKRCERDLKNLYPWLFLRVWNLGVYIIASEFFFLQKFFYNYMPNIYIQKKKI